MSSKLFGALRRAVLPLLVSVAFLGSAAPATALELPAGSEDESAKSFYSLLLEHTNWSETLWDPGLGAYEVAPEKQGSSNLAILLGNAVLIEFGTYNASIAGVSEATLREHTVDSIEYWAAESKWVNEEGSWGGAAEFWDETYESYFVSAGEIMWNELSTSAKNDLIAIMKENANYVASLQSSQPEKWGHWETNGLLGSWEDDTKAEEMGNMFIPVATALASFPSETNAPEWREWMNKWALNQNGLPAADEANPTVIDGRSVAEWNNSHNVWDTFSVENHGAFAQMYQTAFSSQAANAMVHFLINNTTPPDALLNQPNATPLWRTLDQLGTDAGVAADLAVDDRHHIYGTNLLPITARALVGNDPYAARAEKMLLERIGGYMAYDPPYTLAKTSFSGQASYEPEVRAEVGIAYLLHYWRNFLPGKEVKAVSEAEYFAGRSEATDYGSTIGMVAQQSPQSLAAVVTKSKYVKFAYLPQHDDWLFDFAGKTRSLIPSPSVSITNRNVHVYRTARDGVNATATLLHTSAGYAGYATLPNGQAVYATSGLGTDDGTLEVENRYMPPVPGLDGSRTFTGASGSVDLQGDLGDGGHDMVTFAAKSARYVRFKGVSQATEWGYTLEDFEVRNGAAGSDLALGKATTASSTYSEEWKPSFATDGNPKTAWSEAVAERGCPTCPWLQVDLGSTKTFDRVMLNFDPAYATGYEIQYKEEGVGKEWKLARAVPFSQSQTFTGNWLNVDGRAGFVVRGSTNSIKVEESTKPVTTAVVKLSAGSSAGSSGMVIEARPAEAASATEAAAAVTAPSGGPSSLEASLAGGYLSLFNLSNSAISAASLTLPQSGSTLKLYRGNQTVLTGATTGTTYETTLAARDARVEPPRFLITAVKGTLPALKISVQDSTSLTVENPVGSSVEFKVETADGAKSETKTLASGAKTTITFAGVLLTPSTDLARTRTTFPTSPLPSGMTSPGLAVDGDTSTTWSPGAGGRMVVDLGDRHELTGVKLTWGSGTKRPVTVETSDNGIRFLDAALPATATGTEQSITIHRAARYVAISIPAWTGGDAKLADLAVEGSQSIAPAATVNGNGGVDEVPLTPSSARYIRFKGVAQGTEFGYTLLNFEVFGGSSSDLALSQTTTASSTFSEEWKPSFATDGKSETGWSEAKAERTCPTCPWLQVDLGSTKTIDRVKLQFDPAYGTAYRIQTSTNGSTWTDVGDVSTAENGDGNWDEVLFTPVTYQYVRFQGVAAGSIYGYTLEDFQVFSESSSDLALSKTTTASSTFSEEWKPSFATDGNSETAWSEAAASRGLETGWLTVNFGSAKTFDRVKLNFDPAYAMEYKIQGSSNGSTWKEIPGAVVKPLWR